jgi:hypothetical protein
MLVAVVDLVQDFAKNPTSNSCTKFIRKSIAYLTPQAYNNDNNFNNINNNTRESADISTQTNFLNHIQLDIKNKAKFIDTDNSNNENNKIETSTLFARIQTGANSDKPNLGLASSSKSEANQAFTIPSNFKYSTESSNESASVANGPVRSLPAFLEEIKMRQKPFPKTISIESKVKSPSPPKQSTEHTPHNLLFLKF